MSRRGSEETGGHGARYAARYAAQTAVEVAATHFSLVLSFSSYSGAAKAPLIIQRTRCSGRKTEYLARCLLPPAVLLAAG